MTNRTWGLDRDGPFDSSVFADHELHLHTSFGCV
jgi:hypothetical protein